MEKKKIKNQFNLDFVEADIHNHMDEWYYKLIQKTYEEIDLFDVSRMLMQGILVEIAIDKTIDYLKTDPFIGFRYDGELLELLYKTPKSKYENKFEELKQLLIKIEEQVDNFDWWTQEDKEEYCDILNVFLKSINKYRK